MLNILYVENSIWMLYESMQSKLYDNQRIFYAPISLFKFIFAPDVECSDTVARYLCY